MRSPSGPRPQGYRTPPALALDRSALHRTRKGTRKDLSRPPLRSSGVPVPQKPMAAERPPAAPETLMPIAACQLLLHAPPAVKPSGGLGAGGPAAEGPL